MELISDILIIIAALALLATAAAAIFSVVRSLKKNRPQKIENGVPAQLITLSVIGVMLLIALPTLAIGSLVDMCIITATAMLFAASALAIAGRLRSAGRSGRKAAKATASLRKGESLRKGGRL